MAFLYTVSAIENFSMIFPYDVQLTWHLKYAMNITTQSLQKQQAHSVEEV